MIKKDFQALRAGSRKEKHFAILKYAFLCFLVAASGFSLLYFFECNKLGFYVTTSGIIAGNFFIFYGLINFFVKDESIEEKGYEKAKQPWE